MNNFLAIIPARGGSKRLKNKNILKLNNKPLIAWSIEAAKNSKFIDDIIISSDSQKILDIAKEYNVITLKRPDILATDSASTIDVIKHILTQFNNYKYLVLLQPTSPLRTDRHIDEAILELKRKNADAIISVTKMEHSPLWSNTLPKDLDMSSFLKDEIKGVRSQDLEQYYRLNGAIYICNVDRFLKENTLFIKDNIFAYIMDNRSSIDIDNELDFEIAECIVKKYGLQ